MVPAEQEALVILTQLQFPKLVGLELGITAIVKGGSDRHFYRITTPSASLPSMILMVYTLARRDNPKFVPATKRLMQRGVHVPEIYAFDEDKLCVWLQDLGTDDLHAHTDDCWAERRALYESTLREGARIHGIDAARLSTEDLEELEPPFDEVLYEWEQDYFLGHFVRSHLGRETTDAAYTEAHNCLKKLRRTLAREPRCLVHRDFQSQNIMLRGGQAWLVDYQGLRPGLAEYDLASLLYDPYVTFTDEEREELLSFYIRLRGLEAEECRQRLYLCAAQRLMQALGAYANLSRNMGKPHFKQHIPAAVANLSSVCDKEPSLVALKSLFV
jgi:N-acetylmuramate 1-kinase